MSIPVDLARISRARNAGCKIPIRAFRAAKHAEVPFYVACAFLEQETAGGDNVFGHDPTIFVGAGEVTERKYREYKKARGPHGEGGMQGVGPMQLTWYEFQDRADDSGGCWNPFVNVLTGLKIVRELKGDNTYVDAARSYNGSDSYAEQMRERFEKWRLILQEEDDDA